MTPEELGNLVQSASEYDCIRFTFADIWGGARGQTVPRRNVAKFLQNGIGVNAAVVTVGPMSELPHFQGMEAINAGDAMVLPESRKVYPVPWAGHGKYKVGEVLCETHWVGGSYQEACPRTVARNQLQKLKDHGFALKSAFEMEFVLEHAHLAQPVCERLDVYSNKLVAQQEELLFEIDHHLLECGVSIEKIHSESAPGQYEMSLLPEYGIKAADDAFIFKHGVKEMAQQRELLANFMATPQLNNPGNAAHHNHSVWTADMTQNVLFDARKENNLSDIAGWWLGGLCRHAGALTAFCSPTVHCYRRLHHVRVPNRANWGIRNRRSSFKVKNQNSSGCLIENRIPSGSCNPYLVIAAVAAAGLDGIINKIPCPEEYNTSAPHLPFTLQEAIEELQKDTVMTEALGPEFIHWFVEGKKQVDIKKLEKSDPRIDDLDMLAAERKMYSFNI